MGKNQGNGIVEAAKFIIPLTIVPGITLAVTFAWKDVIREWVERQVRRNMHKKDEAPDELQVATISAIILTILVGAILILLYRVNLFHPPK